MLINNHEVSDSLESWQDIIDFINIQPSENLSHAPGLIINPIKRCACVAPWPRISILSKYDVIPICNFYERYLPIGNCNEKLESLKNSN